MLKGPMLRYEDNGIYVTEMVEESAASRSGLRVHDKILQLNGYDFTMVSYDSAMDISYCRNQNFDFTMIGQL